MIKIFNFSDEMEILSELLLLLFFKTKVFAKKCKNYWKVVLAEYAYIFDNKKLFL